jgi:hypothetical protein
MQEFDRIKTQTDVFCVLGGLIPIVKGGGVGEFSAPPFLQPFLDQDYILL